MISEKMKVFVAGSSVIRAMFEEGKKMAAQYGAENVYDFSLGNPNVPAPQALNQAVKDVLDQEDTLYVHGYMSNAGYPAVRDTIAASLNKRFGTAFSQENIVMTVGAAGGLNVILKTLLNPGDEVLTFKPYFGEYRNYVGNYDGVLVEVATDPETFMPDPESFADAITAKTKAVIINTPNNPTGVVYSEELIRALSDVLVRKEKELGTSIYLIADEPYRELVYTDIEVPYLTKYYHNTIVGYSFSKSLSLPGERIGYLVIPNEIDDAESVQSAASIATRILGFVNAPSLQQLAVARCLDEQADIAYYAKNREALTKGLKELGFSYVEPQGAFYLWMKAPGGDDKAFCQKAKEEHILVVPGSTFGGPGYVRIAYCVSLKTITDSMQGFARLAKYYDLQ